MILLAIWSLGSLSFLNPSWMSGSAVHILLKPVLENFEYYFASMWDECSTFTASFFRTWNNSTGIPSPPLVLFVVILPKVHLTLHYRTSGSRWVITPLWLSWSLISFLYSFSVYSCHLFLIYFTSIKSISFLSFIMPIFAGDVPLVPLIFLKRSLIFLILLFSSISLHWSLIAEEDFLIFPWYSL